MEQAHVHRLVVVGDDQQTPIGVICTTDLVRAIARGRPMVEIDLTPASQQSTRPPRRALPSSTSISYVEDFARLDRARVPTGRGGSRATCRRRRGAQPDPAGYVGDARLQRARAAHPRLPSRDVRRLHGSASTPAPTRPSWPSPCPSRTSPTRTVGVRGGRRRARAGQAGHRLAFRRTRRSTRSSRSARARSRRRSASSSTRSTARAAPSASRSATRLGHDALVMIDKVADEGAGESRSSATAATCASSARCRRPRSSTATRRRWPT